MVVDNYCHQRREPPDVAVARLARRQHGIVEYGQLRACGLTERQIAHRVTTGRLHRLHRGVFAVGHRHVSVEGSFMAAVLALGPGAVLSHGSAAVLKGLLRPLPGPIEVSVSRKARSRKGIRVHEARGLVVMHHERIPTTTVPRTILDCAATLDDKLLRRAVREAESRRLVTPGLLGREIARCPGHHGAGRLAALIADGPTPTKSELEDMLLALIERHGLPRPPLINVKLLGHEVDLYYAEHRLVIEADSRTHHDTLSARKSDAARDAALEAAGYRVLRVRYEQVITAPHQTAERIRRAIESSPSMTRTETPQRAA